MGQNTTRAFTKAVQAVAHNKWVKEQEVKVKLGPVLDEAAEMVGTALGVGVTGVTAQMCGDPSDKWYKIMLTFYVAQEELLG